MIPALTTGPYPRRRSPWRTAGLWMAFALPVLAPLLVAVARVQSVSFLPRDLDAGRTSTGTVTLDTTSPGGVPVDLLSSNPAVAQVPNAIVVSWKNRTGTFAVNTPYGQGGCVSISATVSNTAAPQSATLFVHPHYLPPVDWLYLSASSVVGRQTLTGTVDVGQQNPQLADWVVQLTSSNPSVTVPPSVTLSRTPAGMLTPATFNITAAPVKAPACAIITAAYGGLKSGKLLKLSNSLGIGIN